MSSLMDMIKKKKSEVQSRGKKDRPVKPPQGKSRWRILGVGDDFSQDFGQHYIKGDDGAVKAVYTCDYVTHGEKCEVCDAIQVASMAAGTDAELKLIKDMKAGRQILVNAYAYEGEKKDQVVILGLPNGAFEQVLAIFETFIEDTEENPMDPEKGVDIVIEKTGSGLDTKYNVSMAAKSKVLDKAVLSQLHDLKAYVKDSEEGKTRALAAVGAVTGITPALAAPSKSAGALTGPSSGAKKAPTVIDHEELDDEIPFEGGKSSKAGKSSADEFNEPLKDDDIDSMLAELD